MKTRLQPWIRRCAPIRMSRAGLPVMCSLAAVIITGAGLLALRDPANASPSSSNAFTPLMELANTDIALKSHDQPVSQATSLTSDLHSDSSARQDSNQVSDKSDTTNNDQSNVTVVSESPIKATPSDIRYFDGRPIRPIKTVTMVVTAYSPDARSCAPFDDGITASGLSVETNGGYLIAADKKFKFGTIMSVPGYNGNRPTPVLDRGGAIKGNRLDLLYPTHAIARKWGRQKLDVVIWEYADGDNSLGLARN